MRKHIAIPCETTLNCPYIVMYYDADMADADGHGWCVEMLPGSSTQRYETFEQMLEYLANDKAYRNHIEVVLT